MYAGRYNISLVTDSLREVDNARSRTGYLAILAQFLVTAYTLFTLYVFLDPLWLNKQFWGVTIGRKVIAHVQDLLVCGSGMVGLVSGQENVNSPDACSNTLMSVPTLSPKEILGVMQFKACQCKTGMD